MYKIQNKWVHPLPPPVNYFAKERKTKEKKICDLFCACLYFEEEILNQNC